MELQVKKKKNPSELMEETKDFNERMKQDTACHSLLNSWVRLLRSPQHRPSKCTRDEGLPLQPEHPYA